MFPLHLDFEMKHRERELARNLERRLGWRLFDRRVRDADVPVATPSVHAAPSAPKKTGGKPRAA
jgi:hypothetical protein